MGTTALPQVEPSPAHQPGEKPQQALVASPQSLETALLIPANTLTARLPVELDVAIPLRGFRVRNLLALDTGTVVESQWGQGDDVPLGSGDVQLAWSEFEVVDTELAVRLTRLV
jgi:flagellar motor switch/type III secretory pathway protein FliN